MVPIDRCRGLRWQATGRTGCVEPVDSDIFRPAYSLAPWKSRQRHTRVAGPREYQAARIQGSAERGQK